MHKDSKTKRAAIREMQEREFRKTKHVDPKALEIFRAKPYAFVYKEKLEALKKEVKKDE